MNSIRSRIINGIHNLNKKPISNLVKKTMGRDQNNIVKSWAEIVNAGVDLDIAFACTIGNGKNLLFWEEDWTINGALDK